MDPCAPATSPRPPLRLFKDAPAPGREPGQAPGQELDPGEGGRALLCRTCGQRITSEDRRTQREGQHRHVFANPYGHVFDLALFSEAPGCAALGPPSLEFPWFPGCAWQVAACRGCLAHLGWRFAPQAGGAAFFGLIADRLVEGPDQG